MSQKLWDLSIDEVVILLLTGVIIYTGLIFILRISGKRTLSKWNSFDFIITIATGSIFATALLTKDVSALEGLFAFIVVVLLQFIVTWLSVRLPFVQHLVKSSPTLLVYKGKFLEESMKDQRVSKMEVYAALRSKGIGEVKEVDAVVLETEGTFSVIKDLDLADETTTLKNVHNYDELFAKEQNQS